MLSRAKQLVARLLGPVLLLPLASMVCAEEGGSWGGLNMTRGVTSVSRQVYDLHMIVFWICVVIGVIVFGVMFYSMFAHRKSRGYKASNFHESTSVEIAWTVIPTLILLVVAFPATKSLLDLYDTSAADMDVKVTAYQWKWQYEYMGEGVSFMSELSTPETAIYNTTPKSEFYLQEVSEALVLPVGKKIRFLITAKDVLHAWWVPAFAVKRDAIPGFINETWTRIDEPGIYRGECAELCGKGHAFMPIVVRAVPEEEFNVWLAEKKVAMAAERELTSKQFSLDELMVKGEDAYNRSCAACHMGNGEGIPGVFPTLKGSPIAVGAIADHMDMVINGKSGTAMQAFGGQLSEVDLAAIITYERNAWGNSTGDVVQPVDVLKFKQGREK